MIKYVLIIFAAIIIIIAYNMEASKDNTTKDEPVKSIVKDEPVKSIVKDEPVKSIVKDEPVILEKKKVHSLDKNDRVEKKIINENDTSLDTDDSLLSEQEKLYVFIQNQSHIEKRVEHKPTQEILELLKNNSLLHPSN